MCFLTSFPGWIQRDLILKNVIVSTDEKGEEHVLFTPLAPFETPGAIDSICENFNHIIETEELDAILLIPIFIHDFLCIHPFGDGNGRKSGVSK